MSINVNTNTNTVTIQDASQTITIIDNGNANTINIPQPLVNVIEVATPGPAGPAGANGSSVDTSGFVTTSSFNAFTSSINTFTASYNTGSFSGSFTGNLTGTSSWAQSTSQAVSSSYALTASYALNIPTIDLNGYVTTSSFNSFTSSYNTGSFSGSFIGSFNGTSSWARSASQAISSSYASTASNILGGKATHIPFFITDTSLATSSIYQSGSTTVIINQDSATTANPEALYVYQPSQTSFNVISGKGNLNNYLQLNIQNTNQGTNASSDVVATAGNGNETINYIDMGINSDNFIGNIGGPNDAYLYSTGQNLHIGNATAGQPIQFFAGGIDVETNKKLELNANGQHQITGSLDVSGSVKAFSFTGSLQGNATSATTSQTSSYSTTLGASLSQPANNQVRLLNSDGGTLSTATINNIASASYADNAAIADFASIAGNGGVTKLQAGSGVTLIPSTGVGNVTIAATGIGGVTIISGSNVTQSFNNSSTWTFTHNLQTRVPIISVFDSNYNQIIPQNIELTSTSSATITFPTAESGFAIASLGGATGYVLSSSYALLAEYANTASYYPETDPVYIAQKPTLATTGSNIFKGNQTVTGSLFTSGSNTLIGNTILSGSIGISGSSTIQGTTTMTGSLLITGSTTQIGNNTLFGNNTLTGSNAISGSNTIIGGNLIIGGATITGSLSITGSTIQIGNNTLIGITTLTGSILMAGDIIPTISSSFNLGSVTNPWRSIYLQSGSISIRSDILGGPDAIISNANGNVSIAAAGFSITSGSFTPFQISQNARVQIRIPNVPANDIGAFSIIGSSDGAYQPVTNAGGMIHVTGNENASTRLNLDNFGNGGTFNAFTARAARGTASNPSQSLANDVILRIGAVSWKSGSGFTGSPIANTTLDIITLENATSASHASAFQFYTAGVNSAYTRYLSAQIDATGIQASGSIRAASFTGSLQGTASWANNALTASFLPIGTYSITSSWAVSASQAISSSFASTASYVLNAVSASFATTASYALSSSYASTASFVKNAQTASYITSLNQDVIITGSLRISGSLTEIGNTAISGSTTITGSLTVKGPTVFDDLTTTITGSLLVTGSTTHNGNITVTGSLLVTGSTTHVGSVTVTGSVNINGSIIMDGTAQSLLLRASAVNPSALAIFVFPTGSYHGASYMFSAVEDSTGKTTTYNVLVSTGNNKVANIQTYLIKSEGSSPTPTIATVLNAGNVELRVTDTGTFTYRGIVQLF